MRAAVVLAAITLTIGCQAVRPALGRGQLVPREQPAPAGAVAPRSDAAADAVGSKGSSAKDSEGKVVLLVAFAWPEGPAGNIRRSFTYAARQAYPPFIVDVIRCASPYEATVVCDSVMQKSDARLVVFAGDEGPAAAVALLSAKYRVPVLKLTSDTRSYTRLSPYLFEFLASGERQAEVLGEFAVKELRLAQLMILSPADTRGDALGSSFRSGVERAGGTVEDGRGYEPETQNVRPELAAIFSSDARAAGGRAPITAALTPEERTEAFGDSQRGEVLFSGTENDSASVPPLLGEGLFFVVSPDKAESFAGQLTLLPKGTMLLGNSSWVNFGALAGANANTDGMHIVVPLLPKVIEKDALLAGYEAETGGEANEWELLGLDAGDFVGKVMASPRAKQDWAKLIPQMPRFAGRAVEVDFGGSRENRVAKVLRFEDGELVPVR
jgi:hypothetical protein